MIFTIYHMTRTRNLLTLVKIVPDVCVAIPHSDGEIQDLKHLEVDSDVRPDLAHYEVTRRYPVVVLIWVGRFYFHTTRMKRE